MKIYTTKKALMESEEIKRALMDKLLKLNLVKEVINQHGKKVGYYLVK